MTKHSWGRSRQKIIFQYRLPLELWESGLSYYHSLDSWLSPLLPEYFLDPKMIVLSFFYGNYYRKIKQHFKIKFVLVCTFKCYCIFYYCIKFYLAQIPDRLHSKHFTLKPCCLQAQTDKGVVFLCLLCGCLRHFFH